MRGNPISRGGFTLIEILVTVSVISILTTLALYAVGVAMRSARETRSRQLVVAVSNAMDVYRGEDKLGRFPPAAADRSIACGLDGTRPWLTGNVLTRVGLAVHGEQLVEGAGGDRVLADAWGQPLMYHLDAGGNALADPPLDEGGTALQLPVDCPDWNPRVAEPYAYVWSWGNPGTPRTHAAASRWLYRRQGGR